MFPRQQSRSFKTTWKEKEALAALELKKREEALAEVSEGGRWSLSRYIKESWQVIEPVTPYIHNWHIDCISEHLEAVTAGQILRLIVNMPPRYMKSITVSVDWPTWEWTFNPGTRWMFASYAASLSQKHSVDRRQLIQSDWYRRRWGHCFEMAPDQNQKTEFMNDRRGVMFASSVGGTVTGKGGNRLVFDDVHNPKNADSDVEREAGIKFFTGTAYSRLDNKKADAIVVVMQRLHERDLTGHLLESGDWVHLCLPAECHSTTTIFGPLGKTYEREAGSLLWPEREGPKEIAATKKVMTAYEYAGQYDQAPAPPGGGMFPRDLMRIVEQIGGRVEKVVRYWDKAGTQDGGCWTVGTKMAKVRVIGMDDPMYYVLHVVRGQWGDTQRENVISETANLDGRAVEIGVEQEPGSGGKQSAQITARRLAGFIAFIEPVTGTKEARARPFAAQCQADNVRLIKGPWNQDYLDELGLFPNSQFKDQVDASSGAFNRLALTARAGRPAGGGQRPALNQPVQGYPGVPPR